VEDGMEKRTLGRAGLEVSAIGPGAASTPSGFRETFKRGR